jgi:hypothetical protein
MISRVVEATPSPGKSSAMSFEGEAKRMRLWARTPIQARRLRRLQQVSLKWLLRARRGEITHDEAREGIRKELGEQWSGLQFQEFRSRPISPEALERLSEDEQLALRKLQEAIASGDAARASEADRQLALRALHRIAREAQ